MIGHSIICFLSSMIYVMLIASVQARRPGNRTKLRRMAEKQRDYLINHRPVNVSQLAFADHIIKRINIVSNIAMVNVRSLQLLLYLKR